MFTPIDGDAQAMQSHRLEQLEWEPIRYSFRCAINSGISFLIFIWSSIACATCNVHARQTNCICIAACMMNAMPVAWATDSLRDSLCVRSMNDATAAAAATSLKTDPMQRITVFWVHRKRMHRWTEMKTFPLRNQFSRIQMRENVRHCSDSPLHLHRTPIAIETQFWSYFRKNPIGKTCCQGLWCGRIVYARINALDTQRNLVLQSNGIDARLPSIWIWCGTVARSRLCDTQYDAMRCVRAAVVRTLRFNYDYEYEARIENKLWMEFSLPQPVYHARTVCSVVDIHCNICEHPRSGWMYIRLVFLASDDVLFVICVCISWNDFFYRHTILQTETSLLQWIIS